MLLWTFLSLLLGVANGGMLSKWAARVDDKKPLAAALWLGSATIALELSNQIWAERQFHFAILLAYVVGLTVATYFVIRGERERERQ